ncbi:MAG: UDP-N-acetylmuramate--L-alanine ligase [Chitinophagaceae bacterium]
MINLPDIQQVYFIGIGGIGMSAVARYFSAQGVKVSGYDRAPTTLTRMLEAAGIDVRYEENVETLPKIVDLVVYTPAVPATNTALIYYRENGYTVMKRSEVLELITTESVNICIAGTHGKTTISTMTAHILRHSGMGCNAFLGGISKNYNTNFWGYKGALCVIEADEYDRSFLKLHPDTAVISSMDADHLDIYGTEESLQDAFLEFSYKVKPGGMLLSKYGLPRSKEMNPAHHLTYSLLNDMADVYAGEVQIKEGTSHFNVHIQGETLYDMTLTMGGMHNVENALAAIAVSRHAGVNTEKIRAALLAFAGIKRRFEYVVKDGRVTYIDDYAHHPAELTALLKGARSIFPGQKITLIFQPHLFSRTKDHAEEFAHSLELADEVILLPIYPARELPMEEVSSEMIQKKMHQHHSKIMSKEETLHYLEAVYAPQLDYDMKQVIITAGAGDIDQMVEKIKLILEKLEW